MKYLHKFYSFIILYLRTNKLVHFVLFGYFPGPAILGNYWDWTTISIKNLIKLPSSGVIKILDLGTGPYAVLARFTASKFPTANVIAADYIEELINNAKLNNSCDNIKFLQSDLFENLNDRYDIILFNAPYIMEDDGNKLDIFNNSLAKKRWSGGEQGITTISKFVNQAQNHLTDSGYCLLGVNHFYLKHDILEKVLKENSELEIISYSKNKLTLTGVYKIKRIKK